MSFSNTRCHLGAGLPGHRSLDKCKAACSRQIDCTFFLFNKNSKYKENCWIAKKSHTMSSDCVMESGSWTVYKPVAVDRSRKWNLLPSKKCTLGDGEPGSMSVDACAKACSNNGCPFFLYNPISPYNENCWTASKGDTITAKCKKHAYGFFLYMRPAPISGWKFRPNTKCNIGDGEAGVKSVAQCADKCGADCPFFLYHPRSPHKERCWTANSTQNVGHDCAYGAGYVLYQRETDILSTTTTAKKISTPATSAGQTAPVTKKSTGTTAAPEVCAMHTKELGNGVCDTNWNNKKVVLWLIFNLYLLAMHRHTVSHLVSDVVFSVPGMEETVAFRPVKTENALAHSTAEIQKDLIKSHIHHQPRKKQMQESPRRW